MFVLEFEKESLGPKKFLYELWHNYFNVRKTFSKNFIFSELEMVNLRGNMLAKSHADWFINILHVNVMQPTVLTKVDLNHNLWSCDCAMKDHWVSYCFFRKISILSWEKP